jgi:hypothetical protein
MPPAPQSSGPADQLKEQIREYAPDDRKPRGSRRGAVRQGTDVVRRAAGEEDKRLGAFLGSTLSVAWNSCPWYRTLSALLLQAVSQTAISSLLRDPALESGNRPFTQLTKSTCRTQIQRLALSATNCDAVSQMPCPARGFSDTATLRQTRWGLVVGTKSAPVVSVPFPGRVPPNRARVGWLSRLRPSRAGAWGAYANQEDPKVFPCGWVAGI